MELYDGNGYWGKCPSCGADGFWEHIIDDPDDVNMIRCECGHEVIL